MMLSLGARLYIMEQEVKLGPYDDIMHMWTSQRMLPHPGLSFGTQGYRRGSRFTFSIQAILGSLESVSVRHGPDPRQWIGVLYE